MLIPKTCISIYFLTSDVIKWHLMSFDVIRCHVMSYNDVRCQKVHWYICFWNQHGISDHLSLLWVKSDNVVEKIIFSSKGPPFGFWPILRHLSRAYIGLLTTKIKTNNVSQNPSFNFFQFLFTILVPPNLVSYSLNLDKTLLFICHWILLFQAPVPIRQRKFMFIH